MEAPPAIAQAEVEASLIGSVRETITVAKSTEDAVNPLSDRLVERLTGRTELAVHSC